MRPIEFFLAYRFLREGRTQTLFLFGGASTGVAVIIFLTSLIIGLQASIIDTTLGLQPEISIEAEQRLRAEPVYTGAEGETVLATVEARPRRIENIDNWRYLVDRMEADPEIRAAASMVSGSGRARRGAIGESIQLRGVDPDAYDQIIDISGRLDRGDFRVDDAGAVIGIELAEELGVDLGDRIRLLGLADESRSFVLRGIFDLGAGPANRTWVFVSLRAGQSLLGLSTGTVTRVEAAVDDVFAADDAARRLQGITDYDVTSWEETNEDLLRALRTQSASTALIAIFVSIAVALGIASVLIVTVIQKRGQIGVLRAVGTGRAAVLRVFLIQGAAVGLVSSIIGSAAGTALAQGFNRLARGPEGVELFPIDPSPTIFFAAFLLATLTGLVAAIAPARRAARLDPSDAITNA